MGRLTFCPLISFRFPNGKYAPILLTTIVTAFLTSPELFVLGKSLRTTPASATTRSIMVLQRETCTSTLDPVDRLNAAGADSSSEESSKG